MTRISVASLQTIVSDKIRFTRDNGEPVDIMIVHDDHGPSNWTAKARDGVSASLPEGAQEAVRTLQSAYPCDFEMPD